METNVETFFMCIVTHELDSRDKESLTENDLDEIFEKARNTLEPAYGLIDDDFYSRTKKNFQSNIPVLDCHASGVFTTETDKWFSSLSSKENIYWKRYKNYLVSESSWMPQQAELLQKTVIDIRDHLGNPKSCSPFSVKGLVIGNIQSGKTSNYIGLINDSAYAGYKIIVLLTGTTENLRRQTQIRIEKGFTGHNSDEHAKWTSCGVGLFDNKNKSCPYPMAFTVRDKDFSDNNNSILGPYQGNRPAIFVIKKNVSVLNRLIKYFGSQFGKSSKIELPLLLVDDEADNASINTRNDDTNPTKINQKIRDLLGMFSKSSYVGYTATPFANIFILPDSKDKMGEQELFPKDFIIYLENEAGEPKKVFNKSHYIGPNEIFSNNLIPDSDTYYMLQEISDVSFDNKNKIPLWNNRSFEDFELYPSLKAAICSFCIANVLMDLRGLTSNHRTRRINRTPYIRIQDKIFDKVYDYLSNLKNDISDYASLQTSENQGPYISDLLHAWQTVYQNKIGDGFSFNEIVKFRPRSIADVEIKKVNSLNKDSLQYEAHKEKGLRVIAIGGFALSRGLTLEGLIVSYFLRDTITYDVLMQMGRWFGYRPGYADLCRLWMLESSILWYRVITETINRLHNDMDERNKRTKPDGTRYTPKDFGIRVWDASMEIGQKAHITAPNKMRSARIQRDYVSINGQVFETPYFSVEQILKEEPLNFFLKWIKCFAPSAKKVATHLEIPNVPTKNIIDFLKGVREFIVENRFTFSFNVIQMVQFLEKQSKNRIMNFTDVAILGGQSPFSFSLGEGNLSVKCQEAGFDLVDNNKTLRIRGSSARLGSKTDTKIFAQLPPSEKTTDEPEQFYMRYHKQPLLLVYPIRLKEPQTEVNNFEELRSKTLLGFALAFPGKYEDVECEQYYVNSGANYYKYKPQNDIKDETED